MKEKESNKKCDCGCRGKGGMTNPTGAVYGLGFIGAAVYYIQQADTFWVGVLGVLKAIVWPALMVYKALDALKM